MGTLGCINDMQQRDKENRELRKRNRERLSDTYHRLLDTRKSTDLSQVTLEKMEDIRRKTLEKEELDKAVYFKAMLYISIGAGLILLLVWLLIGCDTVAGNNQNISDTQKVRVKSIKEYVNDNDFIEIIPNVYANQATRSSISVEEQKNFENQMVAATYRFYKHCTQDDKGRILCNLTCGKDINISEELFQRKMRDIEETNKFVEKHLKAGTKYRVGKLDEKYLNSLLNYEAK